MIHCTKLDANPREMGNSSRFGGSSCGFMGVMNIRLICAALVLAGVSGCKSYEATFLPGCAAYTGDRIELRNGAFEWDKFTDAIEVDEDGRPVDAFPDFPKRGNYVFEDQKLLLAFEADGATETFHIYQHESMGLQLLTDAQLAAVNGGLDEDCALTRVGDDR